MRFTTLDMKKHITAQWKEAVSYFIIFFFCDKICDICNSCNYGWKRRETVAFESTIHFKKTKLILILIRSWPRLMHPLMWIIMMFLQLARNNYPCKCFSSEWKLFTCSSQSKSNQCILPQCGDGRVHAAIVALVLGWDSIKIPMIKKSQKYCISLRRQPVFCTPWQTLSWHVNTIASIEVNTK